MVRRVVVEGYNDFKAAIATEVGKNKDIYVLFCGSKSTNGESWCGDCVKAEPVVEEALKKAPEDIVFIKCGVGNREFWKDPKNIFRLDEELKLKCVPTMIKWGKALKLEEDQLFNEDIVTMMFED